MNRIVMMVLRNLPMVPGAWIKLCRYAKHPENYSEEEMFGHIRYILQRAVTKGNIDLTVTGQENIPQESGYMLYANHQGMFDVMAVAVTCGNPLGVVLKKELYNVPFLHQVALCTRSFPMDREDPRQSLKVIQSVIREVKAGRNYLIFPEGTRSRQGNTLLPFHSGSFRCATKSGCPIVPVALVDNFKVLDQKGSGPVAVQIHYLKPITQGEYGSLSTTELAQLVQNRIQEAMDLALKQEGDRSQ